MGEGGSHPIQNPYEITLAMFCLILFLLTTNGLYPGTIPDICHFFTRTYFEV